MWAKVINYTVVIGRTMLASRCKVDAIRPDSLDHTSSNRTIPPHDHIKHSTISDSMYILTPRPVSWKVGDEMEKGKGGARVASTDQLEQ